jgi:small subunit ribosomal protein S6
VTVPPPTYDLTLVLDPQGAEDERERIVREARGAIEGAGELVRHDDWGERPLAYPIRRRATGHYHLLQFRPSGTAVLSTLDHSLRIADGVLRFRIIKLPAGAAEAAPAPPPAARRAEQREAPPAVEEPAPAGAGAESA